MHISLLCPIMLRKSFTRDYKQIHCTMPNLVVCDEYNIAFTKAPCCKVLLIVKGDNSDVMCKLKGIDNREDNSATLNSE